MSTNFDFNSLRDKDSWKRVLAFFLAAAMLLTGIAVPDSPLGPMTAYASASGDARGTYYKNQSFPLEYLEDEDIYTITTMGSLGNLNAVTWYQFTPQETAMYTFRSHSLESPDTYGSIYIKNEEDGYYERVASDDDSGGDGNYRIVTTLNAGTTYYLCAGYYYANPEGTFEAFFSKNYITDATAKINGVEKTSVTTKNGQSYVLEADVNCISGTTPAYEWYTYTFDGQSNVKKPLAGTGNKYTYTVADGANDVTRIFCTATAGTQSETLIFYLHYYPIRVIDTFVDGKATGWTNYQMNRTYTLQVNALSTIGSPLTYTWKLNETVLQTGNSNTYSFTPTPALAEDADYLLITCEISDGNGNKTTPWIELYYQPVTDIKMEINGQSDDYHGNGYYYKNIFQGVPYTLRVSATDDNGKPLTYRWEDISGNELGTGQTYQYTMAAGKIKDQIWCYISNGTYSYSTRFSFVHKPIVSSLTVNGSSASGNAIPVHSGSSCQLKVSAQTSPGKTPAYQWGILESKKNFTPIPGQTNDTYTYTCSVTKEEDIFYRYNLVCRITDSDGNTAYQKCYMRYTPIYDVEQSINGVPCSRFSTRKGQTYNLAVKASAEPGKNLTYEWYVENDADGDTKVANTNACAYTAKDTREYIYCRISDGTNNMYRYFDLYPLNTTLYDFTIKGVSTNMAYAYAGEKVTLELKDKTGMADDFYWSWGSDGYSNYVKQVTVTMGNEPLKGQCRWDDGNSYFVLLPCTSHTYTSKVTKPATASAEGITTHTCSKCGYSHTTSIQKLKDTAKKANTKLSQTNLNYNGKNQKVTVIVTDSAGKQLKSGTDYDYTFNGKKNGTISAKNVGQYTVSVTLKGNYSGSANLTFQILPKKISLSKLSASKKGFKATWKKQPKNQVTGYELSYSTNKSFNKKNTKTFRAKSYKTASYTAKKLKAKTKYFVRIRAYKNVKAGKKTVALYSKWSAVKTVKTRK